MIYSLIESPIGPVLVTGDGAALTGLYTHGHERTPDPAWTRDDDAFAAVRTQLDEYFAGIRHDFDLTLGATGTAFQQQVWAALTRIPYGRTVSYSDIANEIGNPTAVRAVGAANGRNPISIIVPCHRVIGADGSLTGYGGGIDTKRWLLGHENTYAATAEPSLF